MVFIKTFTNLWLLDIAFVKILSNLFLLENMDFINRLFKKKRISSIEFIKSSSGLLENVIYPLNSVRKNTIYIDGIIKKKSTRRDSLDYSETCILLRSILAWKTKLEFFVWSEHGYSNNTKGLKLTVTENKTSRHTICSYTSSGKFFKMKKFHLLCLESSSLQN